MWKNVLIALAVHLIVFNQLRNAGFKGSVKVTWCTQSKLLPNKNACNSAKKPINVGGLRSLRKMILEISASFTKIAQLLMSLAQHASAGKVGVKKNFPQQLLLQQQLVIHQV